MAFALRIDRRRTAEIEREQTLCGKERIIGEKRIDRGIKWLVRVNHELKRKSLVRRRINILAQHFCVGCENDLQPSNGRTEVGFKASEADRQRRGIKCQPVRQATPACKARREMTLADIKQCNVAVISDCAC